MDPPTVNPGMQYCAQYQGPCIYPGQSCSTCCLPLMSTANLTTECGNRWSVCAEYLLDSSEPLNRSCACVLAVCLCFLGIRQTAGVPVPTEVGRIPKSQINDPIPTSSRKAKNQTGPERQKAVVTGGLKSLQVPGKPMCLKQCHQFVCRANQIL